MLDQVDKFLDLDQQALADQLALSTPMDLRLHRAQYDEVGELARQVGRAGEWSDLVAHFGAVAEPAATAFMTRERQVRNTDPDQNEYGARQTEGVDRPRSRSSQQ